ncbi:alpha/beta hydrolase family protein [Paenibacillus thermotolerans]|uniref:alpha/beta hydrolase family protein n=1 Tax=Paenibacillus thermotolerans TaxID=3027807 RepID=UPI002368DF76|nr:MULTISPECIES: prolyl oligopeptidase family serine peptidase [unclassified Paenibacillus]
MIYHVTYLSDGFKVKGYLGLPPEYIFQSSGVSELVRRCFAHTDAHLPVSLTACSIRSGTDIAGAKLPAFLYCRGGIGKVGMVKQNWVEQFAGLGYVVFAPSYRGNEGGEGRDEFGGAEQQDVRAAYDLLRSLPFVDSERISVMGFSRGAINAAKAAAEIEGIHKLILWGGVSDLVKTYEERVDLRRMLKRVIGGTPSNNPEAYKARSPLYWADRIRCPVLIVHGTVDQQVDISHGERMYDRLLQLGRDVSMHRYEGYGHHMALQVHEAAVERMVDWLKT